MISICVQNNRNGSCKVDTSKANQSKPLRQGKAKGNYFKSASVVPTDKESPPTHRSPSEMNSQSGWLSDELILRNDEHLK